MCPSAPRVCSEPGDQKPVLSLSLDRIISRVCSGVVDVSKVAYRPRESPYPLISVEEAVDTVLNEAFVLGPEQVYFKGNMMRSHYTVLFERHALV